MSSDQYRLMARLNDTEPKCATCAFWDGATNTREDEPQTTAANCNRNGMKTLNLMVCTGWHDREADVEIIP